MLLASPLSVTSFEVGGVVSNGEFILSFDSATSRYYQVWTGTNLVTGAYSLASIELGMGGIQAWTDPEPAGATNDLKFYYAWEIDSSLALDEDMDGIDSFYELQYAFLDPLDPTDAPLDFDGDDVSNVGEYNRLTDPSDPLSLYVTFYGDPVSGNDSYDGLSPVVVDGSGPKQTIQNAVDSAIGGDTIELASGTYSGNVVIDRDLSIRPMGVAVIGP